MDDRPIQADPAPTRPCPICGRPGGARHRPFCSKRCADIDLGRWLKGVYAVPASPSDAEPPEGDDGDAPEREIGRT